MVDTVNDWPGIHLPANECDGITRRSCNDGVCAGCRVFYVYNVDAAAARMTSCRAHRKLYAQDILVDLMALQIKFSVTKVITTDAIQWMKTSPTNSRISTYMPQQSDPHFPDETRSASSPNWTPSPPSNSCPGLGLIWSWPELQPHTAEALSAFHGNHFIYVGEPDHDYTYPPELHDILHKKFRVGDSISIKEISSWPT